MKNYTLEPEKENTFIKYFYIKDDYIVSTLANGQKQYFPNNEKNKKIILDIMNNQVKDIDNLKDHFTKETDFLIFRSFLIGLLAFFEISGLWTGTITGLIHYIAAFLAVDFTLTNVNDLINNHIILTDIEKTKFFKENEEKLNINLRNNPKLTLSLPSHLVQKIENSNEKENMLDINKIDIDNWTLKDLKTIKENIDNLFGFNDQDKEKAKKNNFILKLINKKKE